MSWVKDKFFGGAEKRAGKKQVEAAQEGQRLLQENIDRARGEVRPLFEQAQQDISGGFDRARDIFSEITPQQAGMFQAGNLNAQNTLLAGLPQMQNAILGNAPVDLSGLQASSVPLQGMLQPQHVQQAQAGQLSGGGNQFQGPIEQDPAAAAPAPAGAITGSIVEAIRTGQLSFADMTPAQRQQWQQEVQQFKQGVGSR